MTIDRQTVGRLGEREARRRLAEDGYRIAAANWRCRIGEIDIVAEKDGRIAFVEVRTRHAAGRGRFGTAAESVDERKRRKLRQTAQTYLRMEKLDGVPIRFDVIAVEVDDGGGIVSYRHYEAAF